MVPNMGPRGSESLKVVGFSATARTIMKTIPSWKKYYNIVEEARSDLNAKLVLPYPEWVCNSVVHHFHLTEKRLQQMELIEPRSLGIKPIHVDLKEIICDNGASLKLQKSLTYVVTPFFHPIDVRNYFSNKLSR